MEQRVFPDIWAKETASPEWENGNSFAQSTFVSGLQKPGQGLATEEMREKVRQICNIYCKWNKNSKSFIYIQCQLQAQMRQAVSPRITQ